MVTPFFDLATRESIKKKKSRGSTLQSATRYQVELPVLNPDEFPMVAECLALGGVIVEEGADPAEPDSYNFFLQHE